MRILFLIFILLSSIDCFGQDYIEYHRIFHRIDNDILSGNLHIASRRLDSIYDSYNFIYAKHCIKALQICCVLNDSNKAEKWLGKCLLQGAPLWMLRNNELTAIVFNYRQSSETLRLSDSLRTVYFHSINLGIARKIDSLLVIDQEKTMKVNDGFILFRHTIYGLQWMKNNKRQFAIIKSIIDTFGFPGERLIGLPAYYEDSSTAFKQLALYGPSIYDHRAWIMLIHYFSDPRKDINESLMSAIKQGYLPSEQFGAINDFMAKWGKKKHGDYKFYNVWHHDPNPQNFPEIDLRRWLIGLSGLEAQKRNMERFKDRRINKNANREIMLE